MAVIPDGGEKLAAVSRALKAAGERDLERSLDRRVREPLEALKPLFGPSALRTLPKRGGLAADIARSRVTVRRYSAGRYPGIRLVAANSYGLRRKDQGKVRHPVFADQAQTRDEWAWVDQDVTPGWFSNVTEPARDDIARAVDRALDDVVRLIEIEVQEG